MKILLWLLIGYLIGSIPWGLIIGQIFFHKDIRNYGSGNLGGTNAARVLGKPIGILVIILDAMKAFILMILCHKYAADMCQYSGLAVCLGHCFPVFAGFKGGKAVATSFGYLLGLAMFVNSEWLFTFIIPLFLFFTLLIIFKMVSLASMCSVLSAGIIISIFVDIKIGLLVICLSAFVIYRHKDNIKRIINGKERKINLSKNKKEPD